MRYSRIIVAAAMLLAASAVNALTVDHLRTQYLSNPVGIDVQSPRFSWQLSSQQRGVVQESYRMEIATDPSMGNIVYDSGTVLSAESANVAMDGLALQPSTRYYWRVTVTDNKGETATSPSGNYFETGLMDSGWSGARWIAPGHLATITDTEDLPADITDYTINFDFEVERGAAGFIWGATDHNNYYMWQVNLADPNRPLFRPYRWNGGNPALIAEKEIPLAISLGQTHTMRIEITNGATTARTYIDGTLIDERNGSFPYGSVGMRSSTINDNDHNPEVAFFNEYKVTSANGTVLFNETFDRADNFTQGTYANGQLRVEGGRDQVLELQQNFTHDDKVKNYTFQGRFTIDQIAAGIVFAAKDLTNFHMWQFNLENANPRFRPHIWANGNPACIAETDLSGVVDLKYNTEHEFKIEISNNGNHATTWLDGVQIDSRDGNFPYGKVGYRISEAERTKSYERCYVDNISVTDPEGTLLYSENFNNPATCTISGSIVDGRLHVAPFTETYLWASDGNKHLRYDIDADITLLSDAASLIFSYTKPNCYFMWALNTNNNGYPIVRRHVYANSTTPQFSDTRITGMDNTDFLGKERHMRLEIDGDRVRTYIDGTLVDTFTDNSGLLTNGMIGFRVYKGDVNEQAYWDNIRVTSYSPDGTPTTTLSEDFEGSDPDFVTGELALVDGNHKLYSYSKGDQSIVMQNSASSAPRFRREFALDRKVKSARLYTSGLGVYNVYINGERVGATQPDGSVVYDELMPGWTDYRSTIFYMTHDVTSLLQEGNNAIGATLSSGWWSGDVSHGIYSSSNLAFIAKLLIELEDGRIITIVTEPSTWLTSKSGPIVSGEIYHGEIYDARLEDNWATAGFNASTWIPAVADRQVKGTLMGQEGPTVRVRPEMERKPQSITIYEGIKSNGTAYGEINTVATHTGQTPVTLKKGQTMVVDFGQNASGWASFKVRGNSGTKLTLRFAEMINDSGDTERGNDDAKGALYTVALRSAKAMGQYILRGDRDGETYRPTTTFYGFRYCDLVATDDVTIDWITAETVCSANEENSSISVNDADVNKLVSNIVWGQRSNFLSVPTDCPQRDERLGWTADTQVFSMAASYNAQVQGFYHKWMRDMRDGQLADGAYPNVAPFCWVEHGSSSWADAGIILPWNVYTMYGDKTIIEENFSSMERYMEWLEKRATAKYKYNGADTRYGDWLSFESTDNQYISTAQHGYLLYIMWHMAEALSRTDDDMFSQKAGKYAAQFSEFQEEFSKRYVLSRQKKLSVGSQCGLLLPLRYHLLNSEEVLTNTINSLRSKIERNNNTLSTGFVGTSVISQTLSEYGMDDLAYALLLQHNCPSWLYSVDQGATTIWERWNSYTLEGGFSKSIEMNSFNHYAYGAVGEWLYRYMAGIGPDYNAPGFKHIILNPRFDRQRRIHDVDATFGSNYGAIKSAWHTAEDGTFTYNVTIPANTTATLILPVASDDKTIYEGEKAASETDGISNYTEADGTATMTLGSGSYNFTLGLKDPGSVQTIETGEPFALVPNPAHDMVKVVGAGNISSVNVYSVTGALVACAENSGSFDVSDLAPAVYLVKVNCEDGATRTSRLIKR